MHCQVKCPAYFRWMFKGLTVSLVWMLLLIEKPRVSVHTNDVTPSLAVGVELKQSKPKLAVHCFFPRSVDVYSMTSRVTSELQSNEPNLVPDSTVIELILLVIRNTIFESVSIDSVSFVIVLVSLGGNEMGCNRFDCYTFWKLIMPSLAIFSPLSLFVSSIFINSIFRPFFKLVCH